VPVRLVPSYGPQYGFVMARMWHDHAGVSQPCSTKADTVFSSIEPGSPPTLGTSGRATGLSLGGPGVGRSADVNRCWDRFGSWSARPRPRS